MKRQTIIYLSVLTAALTSGALFPVFASESYNVITAGTMYVTFVTIVTMLFGIIKYVLEVAAAILVILACMKYLGIKYPRQKKTGSLDKDAIPQAEQSKEA